MINKITFLLIHSLLISLTLFSQVSFERSYGGVALDRGYYAIQTYDGGYVMTTDSANSVSGTQLVKTDSVGNIVWKKTYDFTIISYMWEIHETYDSCLIIIGIVFYPYYNFKRF